MKVNVAPGKFDYIFGKVTGNRHNAARSELLSVQMKRLGVYDSQSGRELLLKHFDEVVNQLDNVIDTFTNDYGTFEIRDSLLAGPSGKFAIFETTFQVMPDGSRKFSTVIIKE